MTTRPVFIVFNRPIIVAFVDRNLLIGAGVAAFLAMWEWGIGAGLLTFGIGYGYAVWTSDDPHRLAILIRAMRTRTYYDPSAYRRTERVIQ